MKLQRPKTTQVDLKHQGLPGSLETPENRQKISEAEKLIGPIRRTSEKNIAPIARSAPMKKRTAL